MQKTVTKAWTFRSSSDPGKTYQTLQYSDGSTSCDCMAWTRRVQPDGTRTCRHTRAVDMGFADSDAIGCHRYGEQQQPRKEQNAKERKDGSREVGQLGKRKII